MVELIQKEEVEDLMFRNLGVSRKSLKKKIVGHITSYNKKGRYLFISPDKVLKNQIQENNFFSKTSLSMHREIKLNIERNNNLNEEKLNEENGLFNELSVISENNYIKIIENNDLNKPYTKIKSSIINNVNSNNKDIKNNTSFIIEQNNLSSNKINNINNDINISKIQNEVNSYKTSENLNSEQINKITIQQEYNFQNKDELPNIIQEKIQQKIDKNLNINDVNAINNNILNVSQVNGNKNYNKIEIPKTNLDENLIGVLASDIIKKEKEIKKKKSK